MLNCKQILEKSSDYVDGELTLIDRFRMWFHLLLCKYCRTFIKQFRVSTRAVRPVEDAERPTPKQVEEILEKVGKEPVPPRENSGEPG